MKDLRKYKEVPSIQHPFKVKIGLQTSDDRFFVNHPDAKHKGFKASTLTHVPLLYPYDRQGKWTGEYKEYGRQQGLDQLGVKKIAIPLMFDGNKTGFKFKLLDEETIVYSGLYITGDLDYATKMLSSEEFQKHLMSVCEPKLSGWFRVSKHSIVSFDWR